jgi:hypothetical protein
MWRPLRELLAGVQRVLVVKWCVPDGDGESALVESTRA